MGNREKYPEDSEVGGPPHYHYHQSKNGNGNNALNTVVWAIAALAVGCLITITGIMWNKQIEMASSLARLEAQMVIVLDRLPP